MHHADIAMARVHALHSIHHSCPYDAVSRMHSVPSAAAGLSDTFILMDDDLFLTAPWTLADFVWPDGGQVLTG